ncbi:MAG: tRNA (adenosine(37)-N6)-threonylcarbamoyltransferase complex dimerization subunit type 1 TsaB [Pseudomonadota bacterium]
MGKPRGGKPLFLCFDTSGPHCAVAVFEDDVALVQDWAEMKRGQAEALPSMVEAAMASAGIDFRDLSAVGVGVGPGNFTGIRISVSYARGLALACEFKTISVTSFDFVKDTHGLASESALLLSVEAPKDQSYVQLHRYGRPVAEPRLIDPSSAPEELNCINLKVRGFRAAEIAAQFNADAEAITPDNIPYRLGKVTAWKFQNGTEDAAPVPLYVRPPDAAPPSDPPPVILS